MGAPEILVTGGTGVLGGRVVDVLRSAGVGARVMSRGGRPGTVVGDLVSGHGLDRAVRGADAVIHCASSPYRGARKTDVEGTRRLLRAAAGAGVSHLVYVSIVGVDLVAYPYYRVKLETERVVEGGPIPYTTLRATQFYDLVFLALRALDRLPAVPKGFLGQPVDAGEVAIRLVELALSRPAGRVPDIGGPEVMTFEEAARRYLDLTGSRKKILPVPIPGRTASAFRSGALTCPQNRYGKVRWEDFLRRRLGDPVAGGAP